MVDFKTPEQATFRSRVSNYPFEVPGELSEGTAIDWLPEASLELVEYFSVWLEHSATSAAVEGDKIRASHFSLIKQEILDALEEYDLPEYEPIEFDNRMLADYKKPLKSKAKRIHLKWDEDKTEFEGRVYGWSSSDTPSVWTESGWKPLVWASYHGLSLRARKKMLRDLILSNED